MRIAFWWKLNWAWFCLIHCSYEEATKQIDKAKILESFIDTRDLQGLSEEEMEVGTVGLAKMGRMQSLSPTPLDWDGFLNDMWGDDEEAIVSSDKRTTLHESWNMTKKSNSTSRYRKRLGEHEWVKIGDTLVALGNILAEYGFLDMNLGLWETELIHRTIT